MIAIKGYHFPSLLLVPWCQGMLIPLKKQRRKCYHYILNFFSKLSLGIDKEVISFASISRPCQFIDTLPQLFCLKDTVNPNRKVLLG